MLSEIINSVKKKIEKLSDKKWFGWALLLTSMITVFLLGLLSASIMERRSEALIAYAPIKNISQFEPRNSVWGENFPREYTSYLKTKETSFKSKYNGNGTVDALKDDPKLVILWAGYPFSKDYNQPRGHYYAIFDIVNTLRTGAPMNDNEGPMPNTCWTCKSPDVARVMNEMGAADFYKGKWASKGSEIINPIGCADCHDPKTMNLRITRPALVETFKKRNIDIGRATHQEKRSLVCAQCHVEYYFRGDDKYLTFPWDNGTTVDDIERYYDSYEFSDWTHSLSKAPMLKAQHPEYETWQLGIHAKRGVSCADCHMPYIAEGGIKYTDHHIQSPLNNINRSCQVCHRESEEELKNNVYSNQDKIYELRHKAEAILVKAHYEAKTAWEKGASKDEMKSALTDIRHSQWRLDFAIASHGASFHAPLEMSRVLATSIEKGSEARRKLAIILSKHGFVGDVKLPDISTKERAQEAVGLDMGMLRTEKENFLKNVVPKWEEIGRARESSYDKK